MTESVGLVHLEIKEIGGSEDPLQCRDEQVHYCALRNRNGQSSALPGDVGRWFAVFETGSSTQPLSLAVWPVCADGTKVASWLAAWDKGNTLQTCHESEPTCGRNRRVWSPGGQSCRLGLVPRSKGVKLKDLPGV